MSSFITRFLASMSMKDSKTAQATETRPRRHERSSRRHHNSHRSSYVYDSDETEVETDDEPPANSLMLDLGPDYSPKAMSTISFPPPPTHNSALIFPTDQMVNSPQPTDETRHASAAVQRKPVQYYDTTAAAQEATFRQQRGRSSSRSSTGSQRRERRTSSVYVQGPQWVW